MEGFRVSLIPGTGGRVILQSNPKRPAWAAGKARMAVSQLLSCSPLRCPPWHLGLNIRQWGRRKSRLEGGGAGGLTGLWHMWKGRSVLWGQQREEWVSSLPMASRILILEKWHLSIRQSGSNLKLNSLEPNPSLNHIKLACATEIFAHFLVKNFY